MPRSDSPRLRRVAGGLFSAACFASAFVASAWLIGWCLPFPPVPSLAAKHRFFAENIARFDTIFVGSSRIYHQIDPQQFDAEVAALGGHTQSANLAYAGMWPPESLYFLRRLLALRPPRLRWVFIEIMPLNVNLEPRSEGTVRTAYWHDWRHTWLTLREIFLSTRAPAEKWRLAGQHAAICGRWTVNLGRGAEAMRERSLPGKPRRRESWTDRAGFQPENEGRIADADLPKYLQTVADLRVSLPSHPAGDHFVAALADVVAEVRRAGAQPVFVLTPTLSPRENLTGLPADVPFLAFNDPGEYPALYEPDRHYDAWHLNEKGAAEFTSLLARRFVEHLRQP